MPSPAEVVSEERARAEQLADTFVLQLQEAMAALAANIVPDVLTDVEFGAVEEPTTLSTAGLGPVEVPEPTLQNTNALRTALEGRVTAGFGSIAAPTPQDVSTLRTALEARLTGQFADLAEPTLQNVNPLRTNLEARLAGGTGIDTDVEAGIWDRAREREAAVAQAAIDEATLQDEGLGFDFPSGVMAARLSAIGQDYHSKVSSLSRDIAIEQAKLEQSNLKDTHAALLQIYQFLMTQDIEHWKGLVGQNQATQAGLIQVYELLKDQDVEHWKGLIAQNETTQTGLLQLYQFLKDQDVEHWRALIMQHANTQDGLVKLQQFLMQQDVEHWRALISQNAATQDYVTTTAKINADILRSNRDSTLDAARVQAQVLAQLVAAAIGRVNISAGVSGSSSNSVSYSYSNDTETSPPAVTAI